MLRLCTFRDVRTRSEAAALLYLLMRRNNEEMRQFARMKLQATIAISKLVGEVCLVVSVCLSECVHDVRTHTLRSGTAAVSSEQCGYAPVRYRHLAVHVHVCARLCICLSV